MRHAGGHDDHEFRAGNVGQKRANRQGSFGLTHEDTGGDVHGLNAGCPHEPHHHSGEQFDDDLHNAEVIQHREERSDEDDGRQHLESENKPVFRKFVTQLAKYEFRANERIAQQVIDGISGGGHHPLANSNPQNQQRKNELQH